jgi:transposase
MWTMGIDVAKHRHVATLLDEQGKRVFKNFSFPNSHEGLNSLLDRIRQVGISAKNLLIGMEATGHYWMVLYHRLSEAGFQLRLINPLMTAARRNVGIRGTKTDSADAELIANILREADPKFSAVPDDQTRQLRDLMRLRYECVQTLVAEKIRLTALLDQVFPEYSRHFSDIFGTASRRVLANFPTAKEIEKVNIRKLTRILKESSRGRLGREHAMRLKDSAKNSFGLKTSVDCISLEIRFIVQRLNLLTEQIQALDRQAKNHLKQGQKLLQSIPGIGPVWAATILAEVLPVFHPEEKNGARRLVATAGLDVCLNESGESKGRGRMSKRGSKYLRTAAYQAAEVAALVAKDPMFTSVYEKQRNRGKSHTVAISHVANKMLHVVFSVLKNRRPYELHLVH